MNSQTFNVSAISEILKRAMYALMIVVISVAIPVLSYLQLSYGDSAKVNSSSKEIKVDPLASTAKAATISL